MSESFRLEFKRPWGNCEFIKNNEFIWDVPFREPASAILFNQVLLHHIGSTFSKMFNIGGEILMDTINVDIEDRSGIIIKPYSTLCDVRYVEAFLTHYKGLIVFNSDILDEKSFNEFKEAVKDIFNTITEKTFKLTYTI